MTAEEKKLIRSAVLTLADPNGNWAYAWKIICDLAELNPKNLAPPFRPSTIAAATSLADKKAKPRKPTPV